MGGPPGRLTTEYFYFRRVGRPAGPTGRPSAYVGVRRTKNAETIKANKTCWSNEEAVCRHWYPKGDGSVWADNTDGMTVSKSTNSKLHSIACLISLVSRPQKCGNNQTNKQNTVLSQVNTQVRPQANKQKTPTHPIPEKNNSRGTLKLSWKGLLVSDFSNGHCQKDKMLCTCELF